MPISDKLRFFSSYVVSYDTRLRNPRWVLEHFNRGGLNGDGTR
jgi:hypothetical protein